MNALRHLAVIMDGNGRWATARGKPRVAGHRAGAKTLENVLRWCREADIPYLTVYAFSTENWKRSAEEVDALMKLLALFIRTKAKRLVADKVRFRVIGRRTDLSPSLQKQIAALEEKTKDGVQTLCVALSYGGRDEIVRAAERYTGGGEAAFAKLLDTGDMPDPDLVIRTSGEFRISNFLLWQIAYAEFYVTPTLWPDFDRAAFDAALASFASRERRLGGRLTTPGRS